MHWRGLQRFGKRACPGAGRQHPPPIHSRPRTSGFVCAATAATAALLFVSGCAYVGDPLPPALNIVKPVANLRVEQLGDKLHASFTLPDETTEGLDWRRIAGVEFRIGLVTQPFDPNAWADASKLIPLTATEPGEVKLAIDASQWDPAWTNKEVTVAVRARNLKGRVSQWSNFSTLRIVAPLASPTAVKASSVPKGVRLDWQSPAPRFRIFRKAATAADPVPLGESDSTSYTDATAEFEQNYIYTLQAMDGDARSLPSAEVALTPHDTFPPAVPQGLRAIAGLGTLELAWDPNSESDLKGYVIYRSVDDGPFTRIEPIRELPSYSDKAVEPGKRYAYSIASVDLKGNESQRGAAVQATAPR